jgi:excisionase family DNA binding protein
MSNRITSEEVANQFAKAIQLLLDWYQQERLSPSQSRDGKAVVANDHQVLEEPEKLLRAAEVAEILQVSTSAAYTMIQRGEIPAVKIGRSVRVRRKDIDAFIRGSKSA